MPLTSMTGFGHATISEGSLSLDVEVRTVNSRFLDVIFKAPPAYASLESEVVSLVKEKLQRGRVDVFISRESNSGDSFEVNINKDLYQSYLLTVKESLKGEDALNSDSTASAVLQALSRREILDLVPKEFDASKESKVLLKVVTEALDCLTGMRKEEGAALEKDLLGHVASLEKHTKELPKLSEQSVANFKSRLDERVRKLKLEIEVSEERIHQEIALLADKTDISEELSRLGSHFAQFKKLLGESGTGRKLEFLIQEMLREVNTCGSKSQHADITKHIVDMKGVLEKMREQVQNVE